MSNNNALSFARLTDEQIAKIEGHIAAFKNDPSLFTEDSDPDRLDLVARTVRERGAFEHGSIEEHMLGVYIGNTYVGEDGDPWRAYVRSLGLSYLAE